MFPANSYEGVIQRLNISRGERCLVGLLFAHRGFRLVKREILPFVGRFHLRSGDHVHFFFAGYLDKEGKRLLKYSDAKRVGSWLKNSTWYFSEIAFESLRRDIESHSQWRHSGAVDLLLLDAIWEHDRGTFLDFSTTISLNISREREEKRLPELSSFFETIFRYAEASDSTTTWRYSDDRLPSLCASVLERGLASMVPGFVFESAKEANMFAVRDMSVDAR